ncbi:hypothetical protein [Streptomyces sp. NRRL S-237]|uniref:hypothetical protein n=1 Tax=Streptomyces sp. NRRL S-237 TaxID=1463895 RepID=UPI0004C4D953|nr:hypothetical protein [Streptomyces sp. NRRL S-237]
MPDENDTKEPSRMYRRAQDGTPVRGDLADGEPLPGMAVTRRIREVLLRERDREAPEPPEDGPGRADLRIEFQGPGPADACPPEAFRPAEEEAPGIGDAVDGCLDGSGAEGAFIRLLMERLPERGHHFWLIGGAVRDLVDVGPEAEPNDLDFAGTLPPLELRQEIDDRSVDAGLGDYRARMSRPSLVVHLSRPEQGGGSRILEYKALAVTDFLFPAYGGSLTDDVTSRDLTVNSLYYDHGRRLIVDPTGEGIAHLRARPRVLASRNTERPAGRSALVLLRFLKFAVRYPDADVSRLRDWAAALPADLPDRLGEDDWRALRYSWRSCVPDQGRQRVLEIAGLLGPAVVALVDRLTEEARA